MESERSSSIKNWLHHTFIVLILAMIPSVMFIQVTANQVLLHAESPFWQHSFDPISPGLSLTLYPIIVLFVFAISFPSYILAFFKNHISKSASILKYAVLMAVFTILISFSANPLWQFVSIEMPYVSYREWSSLEWYGSLILVFLIVLPSIKWELNRFLNSKEGFVQNSQEAISAPDSCNPERLGRLLIYIAVLTPYAYQSMNRNPLSLASIFYTVSFSSSPENQLFIHFAGHPSLVVPLVFTVTALRILFAFKTVAYIQSKERDYIVVIVGLLSLILDSISMPLSILGAPFTFGPFPLLFAAGLLTMYKCNVRKKNYSPSSGRMNIVSIRSTPSMLSNSFVMN